jgi:pimeloyl-ACP methyl ester carboxylesterase
MNENSIYKTENGAEAFGAFMDGVLAQWPYPHKTVYVPTRFGQTFAVTAGDRGKPALVMLHGSASNLLSWGAEIPQYMGDYFVIALDIPGEAGKSAPVRPSWDGQDYVFWLEDVLTALHIEKANLMGISFGGWIALKYAAAHPESVDRLVMMTPGGIVPARPSALADMELYTKEEDGVSKIKKLVFGTEDIPPLLSEFFDLVQKHYSPRFGSPPLVGDGDIRGVRAKMLMVSGEKDALFPVETAAERIRELRPDAIVYIIPQGQHGIIESQKSIAAFLRGV